MQALKGIRGNKFLPGTLLLHLGKENMITLSTLVCYVQISMTVWNYPVTMEEPVPT